MSILNIRNNPQNWKYSGMPKEDTQFKPGAEWKGNAGGRPKGSLKDYVKHKFSSMTPEEKEAFLKKVAPDFVWRMGEGNPTDDHKVDAVVKVIVSKESLENEINTGTSDNSERQTQV